MTLRDLKRLFAHATSKTWHRHPNGGGWVENTAHVDSTAFVAPDAVVCGNASVSHSARILDRAQVSDAARVYGWAVVGDCAWVGCEAEVYGRSYVFGQANVHSKAHVCGNARVSGSAVIAGSVKVCGEAVVSGYTNLRLGIWHQTPLYIAGPKDHLNVDGPDAAGEWLIKIGCSRETAAWWRKNGARLGREIGYTPEEIEEYRLYVDLIEKRYGNKRKSVGKPTKKSVKKAVKRSVKKTTRRTAGSRR